MIPTIEDDTVISSERHYMHPLKRLWYNLTWRFDWLFSGRKPIPLSEGALQTLEEILGPGEEHDAFIDSDL